MKILITGAHGQVGQALCHQLKQAKLAYLGLSKSELDITDKKQVLSTIKQYNPTLIINAAAFTAVDKAEENKQQAASINEIAVRYLAEAATEHNCPLIHLSTDYVFDGTSKVPYTEEDAPNPINHYGKTKLLGELALQATTEKHFILRTSWVFSEKPYNFLTRMLELSKQHPSLRVVNDQFGGPTSAPAIAKTLIAMALQWHKTPSPHLYGIYHYSGAPSVSWYHFAQTLFQIRSEIFLNLNMPLIEPIPTTAYPTPAQRPKMSILNCDKIYQTFDITPCDWQIEVKQIFHLMEQNHANLCY